MRNSELVAKMEQWLNDVSAALPRRRREREVGGSKSLTTHTIRQQQPQRASGQHRRSLSLTVMRAVAWLFIVAGMLLAVAAFFISVNKPTINPWPSLIAGFCVTAAGIVLLTKERRSEDGLDNC